MANVFVDDTSLQAIAGAIREKTGGTAAMKPGDMAAWIQGINGIQINANNIGVKVKDGENVYKGQFVSFYPDYGTFESFPGVIGLLEGNCFDAVSLDGQRVFVAFTDTQNGGVLRCCVVTVRPNDTGFGEICELQAGVSSTALSAVALDAYRVMVLYINSAGLHCAVYRVIEDQVTVIGGSGENALLEGFSAVHMKSILTGENYVMVLGHDENFLLSIMELFVESGMNVKTGRYGSGYGSGDGIYISEGIPVAAVDGQSALLLYSGRYNIGFFGSVFSKKDYGDFEVEGFQTVDSGAVEHDAQVVKLTDGRFFVVYQNGSNLYGAVLSVAKNEQDKWQISVEASGLGLDYSAMGYFERVRATLLPDGRVLVWTQSGYYATTLVVSIRQSENEGMFVEQDRYDGAWYAPWQERIQKLLTLADGTVTAWYVNPGSNEVCGIRSGKLVAPFNGRIDGITKTDGYTGDTIEVYVPW